jgi:NAD(P)-dependent dehydrogenase (short-subunit alcohol dehydrogenase family)
MSSTVDVLLSVLSFLQGLFALIHGAWLMWVHSLGLVIYRYAVDKFPALRYSLTGKVILITGCDSGFGFETAKRLDAQGAVVFANCLTEEGAKKLAEGSSKRLQPLVFDVTKEDALENAFKTISNALDGKALWALINNAGISDGVFVEGTTLSQYRKVMEVNYFATVMVCKKFLPLLKRSTGDRCKSRIINIASIAGRLAASDMSAYSASKHAVEAFSDALRREIAHFGVQVCTVEPGFFLTPIVIEGAKRSLELYNSFPAELREQYPRMFDDPLARAKGISENPIKVVDDLVLNCKARWVILRSLLGHQALWLAAPLAAAPTAFVDIIFKSLEARHNKKK